MRFIVRSILRFTMYSLADVFRRALNRKTEQYLEQHLDPEERIRECEDKNPPSE